MRNTIFAVSFASLLLSVSALGAPVEDAKPAVTPDTPSGAGDPNIVVCRAPQRLASTDQFGPQVCLHNYEWWKVAMNGKDIAPDGKSLIVRTTVDNPTGEGDPDAVTCRTPKVVSAPQDSIKRFGAEICRTNRFWPDVIKKHQAVNLYGQPYGSGGYPLTQGDAHSGRVQSGMALPREQRHPQ